jgi:thiamine biosynthesis lipoprotein
MTQRLACFAMGTRFELLLEAPQPVHARAAGEAAIAVIEDWHARLNLFDRASVISHLNRTAADHPQRVDDEFFDLLDRCAALREETGGAFDITVGARMRELGLHDLDTHADAAMRVEEHHEHALRLDRAQRTVTFGSPHVRLDLGGIGKGHALDDAAALLCEEGITSALLHGGTSSIITIGRQVDGLPWKVAIADGETNAAVVELDDDAMAVSTPHGRTVHRDGRTVGHVIDPRTGRPADGALMTAVIGPSAQVCDAWSTALLVLGARPATLGDAYTTIIKEAACWDVRGPHASRITSNDSAFTIHEAEKAS